MMSSTGIGDGQSYVDPQLLKQRSSGLSSRFNAHVPAKTPADMPRYATPNGINHAAPGPASRKRTLGSIFSSSSGMVQATSSIARPFVPPKVHGRAHFNEVVDLTQSNGEEAEDKSYASGEGERIAAVDGDNAVAKFPSVARRVLSPSEVAQLYELIRRLKVGDHIDASLAQMCELLRSPERQELLELMPKVLSATIRRRFVQQAESLGLRFHETASSPTSKTVLVKEENVAPSGGAKSGSGITSFFERLQQQNKRRKQQSTQRAAAVVKDPQCFVCYEITRKAYAAKCGHICCLPCWQKVRVDRQNGLIPTCAATDMSLAFSWLLDGERWLQLMSDV